MEARDAVLDDGGLIRSVWLNTEGSETSGHGGLPGQGSSARVARPPSDVWLAQFCEQTRPSPQSMTEEDLEALPSRRSGEKSRSGRRPLGKGQTRPVHRTGGSPPGSILIELGRDVGENLVDGKQATEEAGDEQR